MSESAGVGLGELPSSETPTARRYVSPPGLGTRNRRRLQSHTSRYTAFMAPRGQLSIRPSSRTLDRLRERARLLGQKHTVLAERYLAEGVLMDEHPGVHFVDGAMGRRPAIMGTGLDVWEIVEVAKDNDGSVDEAASYLEIDPRLVEIAVRYYGSNQEEIDDWRARTHEFNDREEARWRAAQAAIRT